MKIKYEFVTGETVEIEVPDDICEVLIEIEKYDYNSDYRETRRHNSIEDQQGQDIQYEIKNDTFQKCGVFFVIQHKFYMYVVFSKLKVWIINGIINYLICEIY
ncbi:MAG: hypothetical protein Q8900_02300 [Bacillota bacterium]|nr:hypothetical protein [Bacillota bacterium]